jgi:hypothetical protein
VVDNSDVIDAFSNSITHQLTQLESSDAGKSSSYPTAYMSNSLALRSLGEEETESAKMTSDFNDSVTGLNSNFQYLQVISNDHECSMKHPITLIKGGFLSLST